MLVLAGCQFFERRVNTSHSTNSHPPILIHNANRQLIFCCPCSSFGIPEKEKHNKLIAFCPHVKFTNVMMGMKGRREREREIDKVNANYFQLIFHFNISNIRYALDF